MLYKMLKTRDGRQSLSPMEFLDLGELRKLEKDLENLLAEHLFGILFEDTALMPISQERSGQSLADTYALNQHGDLVIFELKLQEAKADAMHQILGYAQNAGQWTFNQLEHKHQKYSRNSHDLPESLTEAHKQAFQLKESLLPSQFNTKQHLFVVGNAANERLISAVDFWKRKGLWVDFVPYRVYKIKENYYFEFFSLPYDKHHNPGTTKGVLFDTNRSYDENSIWEMMEKSRVAAYGAVKNVVNYLSKKDIVFFSHKGEGIVAAAEVVSKPMDEGTEERYCKVKFHTPIPKRDYPIKSMPFTRVSEVTGKSFFWARTIKVPYLTREEACYLLKELNKFLSKTA